MGPAVEGNGQLWETTFVDPERDLALAITSIPSSALRLEGLGPDPTHSLLDALRLRVVAEIPRGHLETAIAGLLANTDVYETEAWLLSGPDPVPLVAPSWPPAIVRAEERPSIVETLPSLPKKRRRKRFPPPISKQQAAASGVTEFAQVALSDPLLPFQRSPVEVYALPQLLQGADAIRALLVTARSNPLIVVEIAGGYLLFQAVIGVGQGIRTGLAQGVRYRLLKLLRAPMPSDDGEPNEDE